MIDSVLTARGLSAKVKFGVKTLISALIIVAAVGLPQIVHLALGAPGGVRWLPMYLPVLIGGALLGYRFGMVVGALSPIVSFAVTSAFKNPMPALPRLPYMVFELAVFGLIAGLFSKIIIKNALAAFPATIAAQIVGRGLFLLAAAIFGGGTAIDFTAVSGQILSSLPGLYAQAVIAPLVIIGISHIIKKERSDE